MNEQEQLRKSVHAATGRREVIGTLENAGELFGRQAGTCVTSRGRRRTNRFTVGRDRQRTSPRLRHKDIEQCRRREVRSERDESAHRHRSGASGRLVFRLRQRRVRTRGSLQQGRPTARASSPSPAAPKWCAGTCNGHRLDKGPHSGLTRRDRAGAKSHAAVSDRRAVFDHEHAGIHERGPRSRVTSEDALTMAACGFTSCTFASNSVTNYALAPLAWRTIQDHAKSNDATR